MQNLPVFFVPHSHVQEPSSTTGLGVPHSMQNLPVFSLPH
jgi:hypothetical protein